jgi:hypothetical protein
MIDFIGDIHGHADKLEALLKKMGYQLKSGVYQHPERKVLFLGDYIDRGPAIKETLHIVRQMVENDQAIALMGNHEYNALCFHFKDPSGNFLRKHTAKNIDQYSATLNQFKNDQALHDDYLEWFLNLPLFYETEHYRAVHACWDELHIKKIKHLLPNERLTSDRIIETANKETPLYKAVEETLKGKEIALPFGHYIHDKDGTQRYKIRIKWWENPTDIDYIKISVEDYPNLPKMPVEIGSINNFNFYQPSEKVVFFGHYWLKGKPVMQKKNVCCLDYSVAKQGHLVAFRLNENMLLDENSFVIV